MEAGSTDLDDLWEVEPEMINDIEEMGKVEFTKSGMVKLFKDLNELASFGSKEGSDKYSFQVSTEGTPLSSMVPCYKTTFKFDKS